VGKKLENIQFSGGKFARLISSANGKRALYDENCLSAKDFSYVLDKYWYTKRSYLL